jgi:glycyl-tRNA synthetase beta subunit
MENKAYRPIPNLLSLTKNSNINTKIYPISSNSTTSNKTFLENTIITQPTVK